MAAATGCYLACFLPRNLAPGETGEVTIISATTAQAVVVYRYVLGFLQSSPILCQEIESVTQSEVRLKGNVVLSVRSGNYRTVRGRTLLAAIIDEVAFLRDETSSMPDVETYRALLPALATTGGMLIGISTPYRRIGLLYPEASRLFRRDRSRCAWWLRAIPRPSTPRSTSAIIERARASDPEGAQAEWDAEFRSDIAALFDDQTIEAAIDYGRPLELPPLGGYTFYRAFCDASGGVGADSYTLAVGHKEGEHFVIDLVRGTAGKFDPDIVTKEYAALLKEYHVSEVTGDSYAAQWVAGAWRKAGIVYFKSELPTSQIYLECLPLFARGLVRMPNHPRLLSELRLLERHTHRSGRDTVDHGRNGHDDHANAVCGVLRKMSNNCGYDLFNGCFDWDDKSEPINLPLGYTRETYEAELARRARIYANWGKETT